MTWLGSATCGTDKINGHGAMVPSGSRTILLIEALAANLYPGSQQQEHSVGRSCHPFRQGCNILSICLTAEVSAVCFRFFSASARTGDRPGGRGAAHRHHGRPGQPPGPAARPSPARGAPRGGGTPGPPAAPPGAGLRGTAPAPVETAAALWGVC